jgi:2-keto-4-pentenoate hydratase/2-oxohepta-3-ene-1,7-dioic acid hydratase in catechol pathway
VVVDGSYVLDFGRAFDQAGLAPDSLQWLDLDAPWLTQTRSRLDLLTDGHRVERGLADGWLVRRDEIRLAAPVPRPGKLVCIGLNYRDHAIEVNLPIPDRPVVFSKFTTAVIPTGGDVVLPSASQQVDYEAELGVVIGRRARNVSAANALDYVLGYTALNDVTARDFQNKDGQWQRSKSCDTFAPMGPSIMTADVVGDPGQLGISLTLNGSTMQSSNTNQLIFSVAELIESLSREVTLEPGDVIATGTPPGVGGARTPPVFLRAGDVMTVRIDKLAQLTNTVVAPRAGTTVS